jgi:hypothetical protein
LFKEFGLSKGQMNRCVEGVPTPGDHLTITRRRRRIGAYAPGMSCSKCGVGTHLTTTTTTIAVCAPQMSVFALKSSLSINCIESIDDVPKTSLKKA